MSLDIRVHGSRRARNAAHLHLHAQLAVVLPKVQLAIKAKEELLPGEHVPTEAILEILAERMAHIFSDDGSDGLTNHKYGFRD